MSTAAIRILLVDDHQVVREGLRRMLSGYADLDIVGEAADGESALELARLRAPDVVLLDLNLADLHGLEVMRRLDAAAGGTVTAEAPGGEGSGGGAAAGAPPRVLVLTVHDDDEIVLEAVRGGAQGYVLKDAGRDELVTAIRRVAAGGQYFDSVVVRALLKGEGAKTERPADAGEGLTEREIEVLQLLAGGLSNREIGERLYLSTDTIKTHLNNVYRKLGVSDRAHAVAVALRRGLVE